MTNLVTFSPNDSRWLTFINSDQSTTIFHHPAWMELLSASYGYRTFIFSISGPNNHILAGIPIAEVNDHLTPRRWVALPFSDYCTLISQNDESRSQLASALAEQYQVKHCPRLEIRSLLPEQAGFQVSSPYVLHSVLLEVDSGKVAKRVSRQQMQNVHTAEKNDIRVVCGAGLDVVRAFYHLHSLNRRRHGVPVQPWRFFQLLHKYLLKRDLGFVMLAYKEETCISAGFFLHWQKTLTYKYSATHEDFQNLRPNHLVTWAAMKWGCEHGFTTFDFGRADLADEGLRSFKRRWGANEIPLSYSYLPTAPRLGSGSIGKLNNLLKTLIRRSPVWVSKAIGDVFYRYVG